MVSIIYNLSISNIVLSSLFEKYLINAALYTVWCILYDVWCILYDVYCMMYTVWGRHSAAKTYLLNVYCILYTVWCMREALSSKVLSAIKNTLYPTLMQVHYINGHTYRIRHCTFYSYSFLVWDIPHSNRAHTHLKSTL